MTQLILALVLAAQLLAPAVTPSPADGNPAPIPPAGSH
jgi:hypothetical protein